MLYTTLENVKARLQLSSGDYDSELNLLIEQATNLIDSYIGENLELKEYEERVDGNGNNKLYLKKIPKEVSEIKDNSRNYNLDFIDNYILYTKENIPKGKKNIIVKYNAGFSETPVEIEEICLSIIDNLALEKGIKTDYLENLKQKNIKTQKIGSLSITYFGDNEKKENSLEKISLSSGDNLEKILNKYKNFSGII